MEQPIRIFSTKKLLPNQRQYLLNAGMAVSEADFIEVNDIDFEYTTANDFLIFTSQNAVLSVLKNSSIAEIKKQPCFCVGDKTKELLEQYGFVVIRSADYSAELASIVCNQYPKGSFTFFSGNLRRDILPEAMQLAQIKFDEIEVYRTVLLPQKVKSKTDALLFFSPSAVESWQLENKITDEICFCIGSTTAKALEKITENIIVANQPSIENTIIQCINYYNK